MADPSYRHGVARVVLEFRVRNVVQRNVFHVQDLSGEGDPALMQYLADQLQFFLSFAQYGPAPPVSWMGNETRFGQAIIRFAPLAFPLGLFRTVTSIVFSLATLANGPALSPNCTPCLGWYGPQTWKGGRARTYLCGISADFVSAGDGSKLGTDAAAGILSTWSTLPRFILDTDPVFQRLRLVTYHRDGLLVEGGPRQFASSITGARWADLRLDSQRGRLPGHVSH